MGTLVMQNDLYRTHTFFDAINFDFHDYEGSFLTLRNGRTN